MPIFVFLHVLSMFTAVALAYGPAAMMVVASQRRDVRSLRAIVSTAERLGPAVGAAFAGGIVLGVISIFVHGFDPLQGWLVIAYVLVAMSIGMTVFFTNPWLRKVAAAAEASPDDQMSAELSTLVDSPRNRALLVFDALLIVLLIADMVLKPIPGRIV
jgi:uncharacterized membrane protein